jgi:magnesium chelatase family protein
MQIFSFSSFGYEGSLVSVEVDLRRGIPAVDVVGLADGAVKESRERMRSAIRNSGYDFPPERVLISLSPADLRKEGAGFDLAIALAVLHAKEHLSERERAETNGVSFLADAVLGKEALGNDALRKAADGAQRSDSYYEEKTAASEEEQLWHTTLLAPGGDDVLVMGELELNGKVRPVRGIHAAVSTAKAAGIQLCIVPQANCDEAREVPGMKVFGAENLTEAFEALGNTKSFSKKQNNASRRYEGVPKDAVCIHDVFFGPVEEGYEFGEVHGQPFLIRGLQIAAAGGHNVLAYGAPGCGKTLALQRFGALLPLLTPEEAQPVTRIYSLAGLLPPGEPIMRTPPFRMPHQTATIEGMCGGGTHLMPGEISLAHNGVLFLDEAAEFRMSVLQMLRVPLESGTVTLSRAGRSTVFPAQFQLLMATNPCPCGYYGSTEKVCLCSAHLVEQYWKKFSAPLLDRIDIRIQVENESGNMHHAEQKNTGDGEQRTAAPSTNELREKIAVAVATQRKRQGKRNARLTPSEVAQYCTCSEEARCILESATEHYGFSPRAAAGCLKLARTIADMEANELIDGKSMEEAVNYRKTEGGLEIGFGMM